MALFDRIPAAGDEVTASLEEDGEDGPSAHFTVMEMDKLRVDKISVTVKPET